MASAGVQRLLAGITGVLMVSAVGFAVAAPRHDEAEPRPPASVPVGATTTSTAFVPVLDTVAPGPVSCSTVVYTAASGPRVRADLCSPLHPRHGVGIVVVHGGGGYAGNRKSSQAWTNWFQAHGYLTLAIDYQLVRRGEPGPVYPRQERQVKAAVQYLRTRAAELALDPDRIVLQGISAGAQLAAQVLVTPDDPWFRGDGTWPGVSDRAAGMVGMYGYYDGYQLESGPYYGGRSDRTALSARANSVARASAASGPAFLAAGSTDGLIPFEQTQRFEAALRAAGRDVEAVIVPGAGHGFDRPGDRALSPEGVAIATRVMAWLDHHFPGRGILAEP